MFVLHKAQIYFANQNLISEIPMVKLTFFFLILQKLFLFPKCSKFFLLLLFLSWLSNLLILMLILCLSPKYLSSKGAGATYWKAKRLYFRAQMHPPDHTGARRTVLAFSHHKAGLTLSPVAVGWQHWTGSARKFQELVWKQHKIFICE